MCGIRLPLSKVAQSPRRSSRLGRRCCCSCSCWTGGRRDEALLPPLEPGPQQLVLALQTMDMDLDHQYGEAQKKPMSEATEQNISGTASLTFSFFLSCFVLMRPSMLSFLLHRRQVISRQCQFKLQD